MNHNNRGNKGGHKGAMRERRGHKREMDEPQGGEQRGAQGGNG